jgi:hypothetical protein
MAATFHPILINAPTQARKTQYFLDLIGKKYDNAENTLMVFFTQSNSLTAVDQVKNRMKNDLLVTDIFGELYVSSHYEAALANMQHNANVAFVDFWNIRNVRNIYEFLDNCDVFWDKICVVIDEVEQSSTMGVYNRLRFIQTLYEDYQFQYESIDYIMITATVANLSKALFTLDNKYDYSDTIIENLLTERITEYHYVKPHESYVGPSWFLENNRHIEIKLNQKPSGMTADKYREYKIDFTMEKIHNLSQEAKRLSLVVLSTRKADHSTMADQLLRIGYNVVIEMNSENMKDYNIRYLRESSGSIKTWQLPYKLLNKLADDGKMSKHSGKATAIQSRFDLSLPQVLASACFMGTEYEDTLLSNISKEDVLKLRAIFRRLESDREDERPDDFPMDPYVAIVTGHMAGRGISFQDARVNFVCSSFAFLDVNDSAQRGANNAQRFGRSCGILLDVYKKNMPTLIATKNIIMNAIANEKLLYEKSDMYENGTLVSLKDLISESDWRRMKKKVRDDLDSKDVEGVIDGVKIKNLLKYIKDDNQTAIGRMVKVIYKFKRLTIMEFKERVGYTESGQQFISQIKNGCGLHSRYGKLWKFEKDTIIANEKLVHYMHENMM